MKLTPDIKKFIKEHESDDIKKLALQSKRYPEINIPFAIKQIAGKQIAKNKIPSWYNNEDIIYPKHLSLEQASSEVTAKYKANLCCGKSMVDLTGGMGVDFSFLAHRFEKATYIEQQQKLAEVAAHNMIALGLEHAYIRNDDSVRYLTEMDKVDLIYIDPARRDSVGRKIVSIEDCTPNLKEIDNLLDKKAEMTMIKLSPMLDITSALRDLKNITDIHIISVNNECKELVFIKGRPQITKTIIHAVNIRHNDIIDMFSFSKQDEDILAIKYTSQLGKYLYEPNSSIIKSGGYKWVTEKYLLEKVHVNSHLYTSDRLISDFQGRKFEIVDIFTLNKKDLKEHLSNIHQANITVRNYPLSVEEIRKRTKLKDGGDVYIFATTLADEKKVLILCRKL